MFKQLPKSEHVDFVTATYRQQSIKSYKRSRRGTAPILLLSDAKSRTSRDWKSFMSNDKNRTQLISPLSGSMDNLQV